MPGPQVPHEPLQGQCLDCHLADGETEAQRDELTCPGPTGQLASVVLQGCMPTGITGCRGQEVVTDSASPGILHPLPESLGPPEDNSALQIDVRGCSAFACTEIGDGIHIIRSDIHSRDLFFVPVVNKTFITDVLKCFYSVVVRAPDGTAFLSTHFIYLFFVNLTQG